MHNKINYVPKHSAMQVIGIVILIILLIYAFYHWYISIPILAFFAYLFNLGVCTPQQRRSPLRHILWWVFIIVLTGGMYHRENIHNFCNKVIYEYEEYPKDDILSHALSFNEDLNALALSPSPSAKELYGGLKVGMSPLHVTWHIERHPELKHSLSIDSINLWYTNRLYSKNKLYGVSFDIYTKKEGDECFTKATNFFSQKYGKPHQTQADGEHHIAKWKFAEKHIIIICPQNSTRGNLYIYNPDLLRKKIELYHQEEARKKAELENMIREEQEKELRIQREFEENLKKEELQRRRLRESL